LEPEDDDACLDPDPEYILSRLAWRDFFLFWVDDASGDPSRLAAKSRSVASSSLFPKHIWSCVLVTLKLLSKFLNLYREIIDDASVIVCTAAVCCCELGGRKLMVVIIWFIFV
jgi:hypothetical protein